MLEFGFTSWDFRAVCLLAALWLNLSISAHAQTQPKLCDSEASFGRSDKTLFGNYCGVCHTLSGKWNRVVKEPLAGIFQRKQLVTQEPVNEDTVRKMIADGGPSLMPGFRYTLTSRQIDELVQFLKAADCSADPTAPQKKD